MNANENIMMGVILNIDKDGRKAYLMIKEDAHFIEACIKEQKFNFNVPRGSEYNATFTGELSISLDEYPCEILTLDTDKVQAALDSIAPPSENQLNLFTKKKGQGVAKQQIHQADNPDTGIKVDGKIYKFFNPDAYETILAAGDKLLPPHLSKKNRKKWHKERKEYEALKQYSSMYPSEDSPNHPDNKVKETTEVEQVKQQAVESLEQIKEEIAKESEEYMDKIDKEINEETSTEDKKIDLSNEFKMRENENEVWDVGEANKIGTIGDDWENALFIGHHNEQTDVFTAARTKMHPTNGFKYILVFDKKKTAQFFFDRVMEHGNLNQQITDAKIYKVSDVLKPEQGTVPCLWIKDAWTYLNSRAMK